MDLKELRPYRKILLLGLAVLGSLVVVIGVLYLFLKWWEEELTMERKGVCEQRAANIAGRVEEDGRLQSLVSMLQHGDTINLASSRFIEDELTEVVRSEVSDKEGLEGGFYILGLDEFIGYAYPTSEDPVPVYGPPPRSYNIIRDQVLASIGQNRALSNLHAFDPAVFPLATYPFEVNGRTAGAVWVRIHIERDLPVARLRKVLYVATVIFGVGFLVMALFTLFLRGSIRSIRTELISTRTHPGYRLKPRGGLFGFISRRINEMLDIIEDEYLQRMELEKLLYQKEKLASLGKLIAAVAHEVGTPLSVIKTRLQMWEMAMERLNGQEQVVDPEAMNMVLREINRVSDLMKRLLVFSRPIYEHLRPASVNEIIKEVLGMMELEMPGKQIGVIRRLGDGPYLVNSDPNSLKQVFINVITNAMESLGDRGEIVVETSCDIDEGYMAVRISDDGAGIDEKILEQIFDPFFTTKETGTGLGLAISREIIVSHGGEIKFLGNEPRGTICFITLPLITETT